MTHFLSSIRGSVSMNLGLLLIPIMGVMGLAIETNQSLNAKTRLQAAVDAATLAGARKFENAAATEADIIAVIESSFANGLIGANSSLRCGPDGSGESLLEITLDAQETSINVKASCELPLAFSAFLGHSTVAITAESTATASITLLDLALVVDDTYSMLSSAGSMTRVEAMKIALHNIVDSLISVSSGDRSRIAIIPFDASVNVNGLQQDIFEDWTGTEINLVDDNGNGFLDPDEPICVYQRLGPRAYTNMAPGHPNKWFRFHSGECTSPPMMPLTDDAAALHAHIDTVTASGGVTATQIGAQWAWYAISEGWAGIWPSASAPRAKTTPDLVRAVIIMSDGGLTGNMQFDVTDQFVMQEVCNAMRNDGVIVYTVSFGTFPDQDMRNCSGEEKYRQVSSADELIGAYDEIISELSKVRISR